MRFLPVNGEMRKREGGGYFAEGRVAGGGGGEGGRQTVLPTLEEVLNGYDYFGGGGDDGLLELVAGTVREGKGEGQGDWDFVVEILTKEGNWVRTGVKATEVMARLAFEEEEEEEGGGEEEIEDVEDEVECGQNVAAEEEEEEEEEEELNETIIVKDVNASSHSIDSIEASGLEEETVVDVDFSRNGDTDANDITSVMPPVPRNVQARVDKMELAVEEIKLDMKSMKLEIKADLDKLSAAMMNVLNVVRTKL